MAKRNLIEEILEKKSRSKKTVRFKKICNRLDKIEKTLKRLAANSPKSSKKIDEELVKYFPIMLVACIEWYFRKAISDLINIGTPFIERICDLQEIKISTEALIAIQKREVTLGEYVSHCLSLSNIQDVNKICSKILDFDFLKVLLESEIDVFQPDDPIKLAKVRKEFITELNDLFRYRHIVCHEVDFNLNIDNAKLLKFMTVVDLFIGLSEIIFWTEESEVLKKV